MTALTLRVVGRTLLGAESVADIQTIARSMRGFQIGLAAPRSLPAPIRMVSDHLVGRWVRDLHAILGRAMAARRQTPRDPPDLMQMLLDASDPDEPGAKLSEAEVRDELVTFLLAGHETTSNTLAWALYLLSRAPDVEARLREEARAADEDTIASGNLEGLRFTEQVVKEALRLYPPAYILARRAKDATTLGGYDVAPQTEVVTWIYFTHRDPDAYPDPESFRPERFAPEAEAKLPRGAFIPFGAGPRACIGKAFALAEATVALATLYRTHSFVYLGDRPPKLSARITLAPAGGLKMRVV
jgi:cytochrome P450